MAVDDSRLRSLPGYNLRRAYAQIVSLHREGWMREFDIGIYDYAILILIDANAGVRASDLCKILGIAKPNMVTSIEKLSQRGWVERARSKQDARVIELRLSVDGRRVASVVEKKARHAEKAVIAALGEDVGERLMQALQSIYNPKTDGH